jgi:Mg2+ and Co2+ transporter CorA
VLHQLSVGEKGFNAITVPDAAVLGTDVRWIDATNPDETEIAAVARLLGLSSTVAGWLKDSEPSMRPRLVDDALTFVLPVRVAAEERGEDASVAFVITEQLALTAHDSRAAGVIARAARTVADRRRHQRYAAVFAVIDEVIEQYDGLVDQIGRSQRDHARDVLDAAEGAHSAKDVVASGLRLAMRIGDAQHQLRELRKTLHGLRGLMTTLEDADSIANALDGYSRALDALDADFDQMNHRLELTTDAQLSLLSSRQGELNKQIGAWAGIFAVNAVITGWYGMNIDGLPGSGSWVTVAIIMASVTVALLIWFRRIDWI